MIQKSMQCFPSKCGKAFIYAENDMPLGSFHDFVMEVKGSTVERMIQAHKQQVSEMEAQRKLDASFEENCCNAPEQAKGE